jgi:hypothetical protein
MNERAACFDPLSLESLNAQAALLRRIDTKYIVDLATLDDLVDALHRDYLVLEIESRRVFRYDTVYFDSADLGVYQAHLQGRRRRWKLRSRRYLDSDLAVFEVKTKGLRGATEKRQLRIDCSSHGRLTRDTLGFAWDVVDEAYGLALPEDLAPALAMRFQRVTLKARDSVERMTWDFELRFDDAAGLAPDRVIVETKSERGDGRADRTLRMLGSRPVSVSKYCAGIALTRPDMRANRWAAPLRRHFIPAEGSARRDLGVGPVPDDVARGPLRPGLGEHVAAGHRDAAVGQRAERELDQHRAGARLARREHAVHVG